MASAVGKLTCGVAAMVAAAHARRVSRPARGGADDSELRSQQQRTHGEARRLAGRGGTASRTAGGSARAGVEKRHNTICNMSLFFICSSRQHTAVDLLACGAAASGSGVMARAEAVEEEARSERNNANKQITWVLDTACRLPGVACLHSHRARGVASSRPAGRSLTRLPRARGRVKGLAACLRARAVARRLVQGDVKARNAW
jgi:hypothetical protein